MEKIVENPEIGKPLRYILKGELSTRVGNFVIKYSFSEKEIIFLRFENRDKVY